MRKLRLRATRSLKVTQLRNVRAGYWAHKVPDSDTQDLITELYYSWILCKLLPRTDPKCLHSQSLRQTQYLQCYIASRPDGGWVGTVSIPTHREPAPRDALFSNSAVQGLPRTLEEWRVSLSESSEQLKFPLQASVSLHFNCELFKNILHTLRHPSTEPQTDKQIPLTEMVSFTRGWKVTWGWRVSRAQTWRKRRRKDWKEKRIKDAPGIFHYFDLQRFTWFLSAILRNEEQTRLDVLGLQRVEVRIKEIQPHTRWCRHLLYTRGPIEQQQDLGATCSRPPTSQPASHQDSR